MKNLTYLILVIALALTQFGCDDGGTTYIPIPVPGNCSVDSSSITYTIESDPTYHSGRVRINASENVAYDDILERFRVYDVTSGSPVEVDFDVISHDSLYLNNGVVAPGIGTHVETDEMVIRASVGNFVGLDIIVVGYLKGVSGAITIITPYVY